jgi:glycosyltransferase involved in cell wall biosynthesis
MSTRRVRILMTNEPQSYAPGTVARTDKDEAAQAILRVLEAPDKALAERIREGLETLERWERGEMYDWEREAQRLLSEGKVAEAQSVILRQLASEHA